MANPPSARLCSFFCSCPISRLGMEMPCQTYGRSSIGRHWKTFHTMKDISWHIEIAENVLRSCVGSNLAPTNQWETPKWSWSHVSTGCCNASGTSSIVSSSNTSTDWGNSSPWSRPSMHFDSQRDCKANKGPCTCSSSCLCLDACSSDSEGSETSSLITSRWNNSLKMEQSPQDGTIPLLPPCAKFDTKVGAAAEFDIGFLLAWSMVSGFARSMAKTSADMVCLWREQCPGVGAGTLSNLVSIKNVLWFTLWQIWATEKIWNSQGHFQIWTTGLRPQT